MVSVLFKREKLSFIQIVSQTLYGKNDHIHVTPSVFRHFDSCGFLKLQVTFGYGAIVDTLGFRF